MPSTVDNRIHKRSNEASVENVTKKPINRYIGNCSSCKNWSRCTIYNWPEKEKSALIGTCSVLENSVTYYDDVDVAQEKIEKGKIGAHNLYTHENFGCIHYETL